ncbi:MAG: FAD-binding oxidoreductase, partial [Sulfitobacter sp. SK025]
KKAPEIRRAYIRPPGHITAEWLGFRPSTPDSIPVIGRAPRADNIIFAFGHGHLGLTLGPLTGLIVGDLIENREPQFDLSPYSASRF